MFEKLDSINWSALKSAGDSENIPMLFKSFLLGNDEEINVAYDDLLDCLYHQGTVYPATLVSIPIIIDLLSQVVDTLKQSYLLSLLCYFLEHSDFTETGVSSIANEQWKQWTKVAQSAFMAGWELYVNLYNSSDAEVRLMIVFLFMGDKRFPVQTAQVIGDYILNIWLNDADKEVRLAVLYRLMLFWQNHPNEFKERETLYIDLISKIVKEADSEVSIEASMILVKLLGGKASLKAIERTIETAKGEFANFNFPEFKENKKFYQGKGRDAAYILRKLSLPQYFEAMKKVLSVTKAESLGYMRSPVVGFLDHIFEENINDWERIGKMSKREGGDIYFIFPKGLTPRDIKDLTEIQKEALRIVLSIDAIWEIPHNLLEMYGFQEKSDELYNLLR